MTKKHLSSLDVEALVADAQRSWERERNCNSIDHIREAGDKLYAALEGLVSAPTGDDREVLAGIIGPRLKWLNTPDGKPAAIADAVVAAGFRVTPEPVYEYGCDTGTFGMGKCFNPDECGNPRARRTAGVEPGEWEPLPVEGEK